MRHLLTEGFDGFPTFPLGEGAARDGAALEAAACGVPPAARAILSGDWDGAADMLRLVARDQRGRGDNRAERTAALATFCLGARMAQANQRPAPSGWVNL